MLLDNVFQIHALNSISICAFLVKGCADLATPDHAWDKRTGDMITIGCTHYNKTWQLKCEGSAWVGSVGSCNASGLLMIY